MFAMFFFIALYMQNVLGFSPLEAGVRFLPSTLVIMVAGPVAGRMADRVGARPLMVAGLLTTTVALFWQSRIDVGSGYSALWPGFVLMGLGMGLIMSPMSMAAMNAVDRAKAGVASGTLSMFRMVGGTFGVAALGALVSGVGRSDLEQSLPGLSGAARERVVDGLGSSAALEGAPERVVSAAHAAFVDALSLGLAVAAGATLVAAVVAWFLVAPKEAVPAPQVAEPEREVEALAEAVAA
jgi:MFS family permease